MKTRLIKVVKINENIEVLVKKGVENGDYAFTLGFVGDLGDNVIVNTSLTLTYDSVKLRDKDFDSVDSDKLIKIAAQLPTFKDIL